MFYPTEYFDHDGELWFKVPLECVDCADEFDVHCINYGYNLTPVGDPFAFSREALHRAKENAEKERSLKK